MIKLLQKGRYKIVQTRDHNTILYLEEQGYHLDYAPRIGDLLTFSKHTHRLSYTLAQGVYKLYQVKNEPKLIDLRHLELSLGKGQWQGYVLLTGLPTSQKLRSRIEPTQEVISK